MAILASYFTDFLKDIRPTRKQRENLKDGHRILRERLRADDSIKKVLVGDFLQGSYARGTAVRPAGGKRADVDIIVVTNIDHLKTKPAAALDYFRDFLDAHYEGKYEPNGRSFAIELARVSLDLVPTAAPSEALQQVIEKAAFTDYGEYEDLLEKSATWSGFEESEKAASAQWKQEPLVIPDRDADDWEETDPIEQIRWTREKNKACNGHYINVVKTIKWIRRNDDDFPKYPKGYPVEHLCGLACPDGIESVAEGLVKTLEGIGSEYSAHEETPTVTDHGTSHDVLGRVSSDHFSKFIEKCCVAARSARVAYDDEDPTSSAKAWRELLGSKFPEPPQNNGGGGFTKRGNVTKTDEGRFAHGNTRHTT